MNLAQYIDHTFLKANGTQDVIERLCAEARDYQFKAVCVNAGWIKLCHQLLQDTDVEIASVVGFPLGATSTESKVAETIQAIADGATEIDMVINIGHLLDGENAAVEADIAAVVRAAGDVPIKVIIEAAYLNDEQKIRACQLAKSANAAYVKTSTGFGPSGATVEDVALMRKTVGPDMGVKAAGGIRTAEQAIAMIAAGATRIGASSGIKIVTSANESQ